VKGLLVIPSLCTVLLHSLCSVSARFFIIHIVTVLCDNVFNFYYVITSLFALG
jgi:hypothetical protein